MSRVTLLTGIMIVFILPGLHRTPAQTPALTSTQASAQASAQQWATWRGGPAQGLIKESQVPVHWTSQEAIAWAVDIVGEGHSSPIVHGDNIYLTTAYPAELSSRSVGMLRWTLLALVITLTGLATAATTFVPEQESTRQSAATILWKLTVCTVTVWIILIAVFGKHLLDLPRCDIRNWIASVCLASLCLVEGGLLAFPRKAAIRHGLGWLALALAMLTVLGMPHKAHAFRGGFLSSNSTVVWIVTSIPTSLALYWLLVGVAFRREGGMTSSLLTASRLIAICTLVLIFAGITAGAISCAMSDTTSFVSMDEHLDLMPALYPFLALAVLVGAAALGYRKPSWAILGWIMSASWGVLAITSGLKVLEQLANISSYVRYHLGNPIWQSSYPVWSLLAGIATVGAVAATAIILRRAHPWWQVSVAYMGQGVAMAAAVLVMALAMIDRETMQSDWTNAIICLDRQSGQQKWVAEGMTRPKPQLDRRNSPATPTPAAERGKVVGYFGSSGLFCADKKGRILWRTDVVRLESYYGAAASPVVEDGVVIVSTMNHGSDPSVWALDLETGKVLWTQQWPGDTWGNSGINRTPLIRSVGQNKEVVIWGAFLVRGFDLRSGIMRWSFDLPDLGVGDCVASPVADEHQLYLSGNHATIALSFDDLAHGKDPVRWKTLGTGANCSSPIVMGEKIYSVSDTGIVVCRETRGGKVVGRKRLRGIYSSSAVAGNGRIYFANAAGCTTIIQADETMATVSVNDLKEEVFSSPAAGDGHLYIRSIHTLYSIAPNPP